MIIPPQLIALLTFASFVGIITKDLWPKIVLKFDKNITNSNNIKYIKEMIKN